jgi:hypothetical protein
LLDLGRPLMGSRTDSSTELTAMVAASPALQEQIRNDPIGTLEQLSAPLDSDRWIYRIVVGALGLSAVGVVLGVFLLKAIDPATAIPDAMVAMGSAAIAALAALIVPPRR